MIDFDKYKLGTDYYTSTAEDILNKYKALYESLAGDIETKAQWEKDAVLRGADTAKEVYRQGAQTLTLTSEQGARTDAERLANLGSDASGGYAQTVANRREVASLSALNELIQNKSDTLKDIDYKVADIETAKNSELSKAERDLANKANDELIAAQKDRMALAYKLYTKKLISRSQLEQITGMKFTEIKKAADSGSWDLVEVTNW